ncbi:hypothetical protein nvc2_056 [Namao virus]|nr:hypothetical protein nvc2_056 [Namao virus]
MKPINVTPRGACFSFNEYDVYECLKEDDLTTYMLGYDGFSNILDDLLKNVDLKDACPDMKLPNQCKPLHKKYKCFVCNSTFFRKSALFGHKKTCVPKRRSSKRTLHKA